MCSSVPKRHTVLNKYCLLSEAIAPQTQCQPIFDICRGGKSFLPLPEYMSVYMRMYLWVKNTSFKSYCCLPTDRLASELQPRRQRLGLSVPAATPGPNTKPNP